MNAHQQSNRIPAEIRRLASRPEVRRSLCALTQFRVEAGLPDSLDQLLDRLEDAERRPASGRHG